MNKREFRKWASSFSIFALRLITILWTISLLFSMTMIVVGVILTQQFLYLDIFITESFKIFHDSVITILLTRTVGNIFEYNNGGIFGTSIGGEADDGE